MAKVTINISIPTPKKIVYDAGFVYDKNSKEAALRLIKTEMELHFNPIEIAEIMREDVLSDPDCEDYYRIKRLY